MQDVLQEAFRGHGTSNFELEILTPKHHHHQQNLLLESSLRRQRSIIDSSNLLLTTKKRATGDDLYNNQHNKDYDDDAVVATLHHPTDEEEEDIGQHDGGRNRFLLVNVTPRRNFQNEIVGAVFIGEDNITDSCHHDPTIAEMANELRQLIDTANAPIFGIDRDG
jgi:PAS domain-containing protein